MFTETKISYPQTELIPQLILDQTISGLWNKIQLTIKPKPQISGSQWAEEYRYMSPEDSNKARLGDPKWSHDGFEYLKKFEDDFTNPIIRELTVIKSGQTGFTQAMLNCIGYGIDQAPGPMLILYPSEMNAKRFSKRKLQPMIRDTPVLRSKISEAEKRDGTNSTLEITFPGGFASLVSAKSVDNLSMQSIMYLFIDEKDRIDRTAGNEGDTVEIVAKRLQGFRESSKQINISTPTIRGSSRIEADYERSNKQKLFLPCPNCGRFQIMKFSNLKGWRIDKGIYKPELTYYECDNEKCREHLSERDKYIMLPEGKWIAEKPEIKKHAGFFVNELYSTISTWEEVVEQFIKTKGNPFTLQTFVNLVLAETYEDSETTIPDHVLMKRREQYTYKNLPKGIIYLTGAGDFQKDRAEIGIIGWSVGHQCWLVDYKIFYGDPEIPYNTDENNLYYRIEQYLDSCFMHEYGINLKVSAAGLDTRFATSSVQRFIKLMHKRGKSWIFALQGDKGKVGAPIINRGSVNNKFRVRQFSVGTYTIKNMIFSQLAIDTFGPGYIHLPETLSNEKIVDEEFIKQLVSEKKVPIYKRGIKVGEEYVKTRTRNELLDIFVYNIAALYFQNVNLEAIAEHFEDKVEKMKEEIEQNGEQNSEVRSKKKAILKPAKQKANPLFKKNYVMDNK
ncbi:MAG: terminase gpA endonuclease subunit [Candidatus Kapaibacterium sp.]